MKITASINVSIREASKGPSQGKKFASVVGLLNDKSKAIEFDCNGDEIVDALGSMAAAFREKGFAPIVEIETEGVSDQASIVAGTATAPAHPRTWAGKPVHKLTGSAMIVKVVGKEALPSVKLADSFMDSAVSILTA